MAERSPVDARAAPGRGADRAGRCRPPWRAPTAGRVLFNASAKNLFNASAKNRPGPKTARTHRTSQVWPKPTTTCSPLSSWYIQRSTSPPPRRQFLLLQLVTARARAGAPVRPRPGGIVCQSGHIAFCRTTGRRFSFKLLAGRRHCCLSCLAVRRERLGEIRHNMALFIGAYEQDAIHHGGAGLAG